MKRTKGFSLVEMMVAAGIAVALMAITMQYLNSAALDATRKKLAGEQAREMYMLAKATEDWMVANSKTWTLDARVVTTVDALIAASHLPQNFARRMDVAGTTANGVTPFGARYQIAAIAAMLDGKRVHRGVLWETGTPVGWGRYARVGLVQGNEPANSSGATSKINVFKSEVARILNTELRHPAPATANVAAATVRGASGSWTQDVTAFLGAGVTFQVPSVVILAGWPEYGSVLPQTPDDGFNDFGECLIRPASGYSGASGSCVAPETEVHRWEHCHDPGSFESVPEVGAAITFGMEHVTAGLAVTQGMIDSCVNHFSCTSDTCETNCQTKADQMNQTGDVYTEYGVVVLNNTNAARYACRTRRCFFSSSGMASGNPYSCAGDTSMAGRVDVLCCESRN